MLSLNIILCSENVCIWYFLITDDFKSVIYQENFKKAIE
jgi:hypothetical protein